MPAFVVMARQGHRRAKGWYRPPPVRKRLCALYRVGPNGTAARRRGFGRAIFLRSGGITAAAVLKMARCASAYTGPVKNKKSKGQPLLFF